MQSGVNGLVIPTPSSQNQKTERRTLIIHTTSDCTLGCNYCFQSSNEDTERITPETMSKTFKVFSELDVGNMNVIWHGGEPLLMGVRFYQRMLELEKEILTDKKVRNKIQTNGTLINKDYAEFFKENNFGVGVSIDGPKDLHDVQRPYRNGKGSFEDVMRGVKILREYDVRFGVISVLTKNSIDREKEICDLIEEIGANGVKFSVYVPSVEDDEAKKSLLLTPRELTESMLRLYEIWSKTDLSIEPIEYIVEGMFLKGNVCCEYAHYCGNDFYSISPNGNIHSCNRFYGEHHVLGNINEDTLENILENGKKFNKNRKEALKRYCRDCSWIPLCNGGCSYEAFAHFGDVNNKTPYCSSRREIFEYIFNDVRSTLPGH